MDSTAKKRLSLARVALALAALTVLAWNLASFGALVNGREALARELESSLASWPIRAGFGVALVVLASAVEAASAWSGLTGFRTRGIATLQGFAALVVGALTLSAALALPLFEGDPRVLHEGLRRALGTPIPAALAVIGLAAASLAAFQAIEGASWGRRDKLGALVGFAVSLALFWLGLRALVPLVSGAPIFGI